MEFAFVVWMIGTLPAVATAMCFVFFLIMVTALCASLIMSISLAVDSNSEKTEKNLKHFIKVCRRTGIFAAVVWFVFLITPDKETAYAMAAAYGVQSVVQDERVQKIAGQGVDVLEAYLEKTKKELEKN